MHRDLGFLGNVTQEDKLLAAKILDNVEISENKYSDRFTFFLDEHQQTVCRMVLASVCFENYIFYGGYENAQRCIIGLFAPYSTPVSDAFPLKAFTFSYRKAYVLTHRDFLGCLMSLGIERSTVGDIIVSDGCTIVFVCDTVASLVSGIEKVGKVGVKVTEGFDKQIIPEQKYQDINGTVASLRFDCVLSLALRISREKAADLIRSGLAELNYSVSVSTDTAVSNGDVFSARGYGKFRLDAVGNVTKKDRLFITVKKYV